SYGFNEMTSTMSSNPGNSYRYSEKLLAWKAPSRSPYLADCCHVLFNNFGGVFHNNLKRITLANNPKTIYAGTLAQSASYQPWTRHNGSDNILFMDGHASSMKAGAIIQSASGDNPTLKWQAAPDP